MQQRFEAEELDRNTIDYLRTVVARRGEGVPGVYLTGYQAMRSWQHMPWVGLFVGIFICLVTIGIVVNEPGDVTRTSLFLTAGLLLGGWMVVAFIRCLFARLRSDYLGHFVYADPLFLWEGTGRGVNVTPLSGLQRVELTHNHNEGNYQSSKVDIHLANGMTTVNIRSLALGERLAGFLHALLEIRQPDSADRSPAEIGYEALQRIDGGEQVFTEPIQTIPEPHRVRKVTNWLPFVLLPLVALAIYYGSRPIATILHDDDVYEQVRGKGIPELRRYLIDPRNTRHRTQVVELLGLQLEMHAQRLSQLGDPAQADGLADIVRQLKNEILPFITLRVAVAEDRPPTSPRAYLSDTDLQTLNGQICKAMADRLLVHLGQGIADYAQVTEGPAMITLTPAVQIKPSGKDDQQIQLTWTIRLQAKADSKAHEMEISAFGAGVSGKEADVLRELYPRVTEVFNNRLGQPRPQ